MGKVFKVPGCLIGDGFAFQGLTVVHFSREERRRDLDRGAVLTSPLIYPVPSSSPVIPFPHNNPVRKITLNAVAISFMNMVLDVKPPLVFPSQKRYCHDL